MLADELVNKAAVMLRLFRCTTHRQHAVVIKHSVHAHSGVGGGAYLWEMASARPSESFDWQIYIRDSRSLDRHEWTTTFKFKKGWDRLTGTYLK